MKTKELLSGIEQVIPGTTKKGLVPGWENIIISFGEMLSFNDKICVCALVPGLPDIECAVEADTLFKVVKAITEEEITLEVRDHFLLIKSETTEASIMFSPEVESMLTTIDRLGITSKKYASLPSDFLKGLGLCKFNVSDNFNDEKQLYALLVQDDLIFSCDRFRTSIYQMTGGTGKDFLLSKTILDDLHKFAPTEFSIDNSWAHFKNEKEEFLSCRLVIKDNYPNLLPFFEEFVETKSVEFPAELKKVLDSSICLFDENLDSQKHVQLCVEKGIMTCTIERNTTTVKKKLPMYDTSLDFEFGISAIFLSKILEYTNRISFSPQKVKFEIEEGYFQHLVMLIGKK